jgi:hypothetical protein
VKKPKDVVPPPGDRLLANMLSNNVVISDLLSRGLDTMLRESGATPKFRKAVAEFVRPALTLMEESERNVIQYVQHGRLEELPFAQEIDNEPDLGR